MDEEELLSNIFGTPYVPSGAEDIYIKTDLVWGYCSMCGTYLKCPKCGNNSCNGMYGITKVDNVTYNHETCDLCPSIYALQDFLGGDGKVPTLQDFLDKNKN